jgi:glycosyltransferase involved in cell wall biosynthesis
VGTVGGLRPEKNHARLLRACARLPGNGRPLRLALVGDGPERPALERLAAALGIGDRVTFTGFLADPRPALRAFDVFALSSDTEQMPYSLVEAMASGLPAVATDVGDVRAMLPQEAQDWIVPASDEAGLAMKLAQLLHDPGARREIGRRNGAHAAAQFGLDTMIRCYATLFEGLIAGTSLRS